jgi:hypothetical protein
MLGTSTRIWPDNYGADMSRTAERLVPPLPLPVLTTRRGAAFRARDSSLTAAARRSNCSAAKKHEIAGYLKDFYEDPVAGKRPKLAVPKPLFVEAELDEHSDCFRSCHPFLDRPFIYSRAQLVGQSDGSHRITPRGRSASTTLLFWYDLY